MANLTTWQATIQDDDTGAAIVSPVVTVRIGGPSGDIADLYDLSGSAVANPITGGTDGFVQFQVLPGRYWIQAADGGTFSQAWYWDAVPAGVLSWASRAALVADVAAGMELPDGAKVSDGTVQYVASSGATAISDMPGWLPFGDVYTDHFTENTTPGTTDMTTAANAAAAFSSVFFMRPVKYLFTDQLSLGNSRLVGRNAMQRTYLDSDDTLEEEGGATIYVDFGSGIDDSVLSTYYDNAAVSIGFGGGISNIAFWYPNQDLGVSGPPTVYPPAIATEAEVRGALIENVNLGNAYIGLDMARENANLAVRNITGWPLKKGIIHGSAVDPIQLDYVLFTPKNALFGTTFISPNLFTWVKQNGVAVQLERTTWANYNDIFSIGYLVGIDFVNRAEDATNGITIGGSPQNISISGGGFDTCTVGIRGVGTFAGRISIKQTNFAPTPDGVSPGVTPYAIYLVADAAATVPDIEIDGCHIWSTYQNAIYLENHNYSKVTNNRIYSVGEDVGGTGVHLKNSLSCTISDNTVDGGGTLNTSKGIYLEGNCSRAKVHHNDVSNFDADPIIIDGTTDFIRVVNNTGTANTLQFITDSTSPAQYNNIIEGNREDDAGDNPDSYSDADVTSNILQLRPGSDIITYSGTTQIRGITRGYIGQVITVRCSAVTTFFDDDGAASQEQKLYINGSNFGPTASNDVISFRCGGSRGWFAIK